ncbi:LSU ribosomal protein L10P [Methylophilus rhizosphaerae]|uniref:Large ribosomal subunit protein uL10 n=1 Tax=Methylophilus rhizosphaerae TaxID=492660 RepID=A0A1G9FEU5_9PROT|nr:LSU ribosomal protein L10P [Methylophilus rhizosphaerae]
MAIPNTGYFHALNKDAVSGSMQIGLSLTEGEQTLSLNLTEKKEVVAEVGAQVANAQSIVLAEYRGIGVANMTKLRADARAAGVYLRVLKNTLVRRAVEGTPFAVLADDMVGPLVYGISTDPVAAAKVLNNFAKDNELFVLKAGAMANERLDVAGVKALAATLGREELLSKLAGTLNEIPTKFARAVAAVRDEKEKQAA